MDNPVDILKATEDLFNKANKNLDRLKNINFDKGARAIQKAIGPILEKQAETTIALQKQKEVLLLALFKIALAAKQTRVQWKNPILGDVSLEITSETMSTGGRYMQELENIANIAISCYFYDICNTMITSTKAFFEDTSNLQRKQAREIVEIENMVDELHSIVH